LGISKGVAKGDVVISPSKGPMIIEMAARLSGGDFSESLVPLGSGVNYIESVIKIAMGAIPNWKKLKEKFYKSVANRYFFLPTAMDPANYLYPKDRTVKYVFLLYRKTYRQTAQDYQLFLIYHGKQPKKQVYFQRFLLKTLKRKSMSFNLKSESSITRYSHTSF